MHVQPYYRLDTPAARRLIHEHGLATIVTGGPEGLRATYGFCLLQGGADGEGQAEDEFVVRGHIAAADPQAADLRAGRPTMLVFNGNHGYISASWYRPEITIIPSTWNYSAVHLHGTPEMLDGDDAFAVTRGTLERHEGRFDRRERFSLDGPDDGERMDFARNLVPGTAPFRLRATKVEAKAKLSQERPIVVVERVIARLEEPGPYQHPALADDMRRIALPEVRARDEARDAVRE